MACLTALFSLRVVAVWDSIVPYFLPADLAPSVAFAFGGRPVFLGGTNPSRSPSGTIQTSPGINKRMRPHLKMASSSYRLDETYIKVGKQWKYLYRALDKEGDTIEFMLSAKRDVPAVKRLSGSKVMLPSPRPLRTHRAGFLAIGSSLI